MQIRALFSEAFRTKEVRFLVNLHTVVTLYCRGTAVCNLPGPLQMTTSGYGNNEEDAVGLPGSWEWAPSSIDWQAQCGLQCALGTSSGSPASRLPKPQNGLPAPSFKGLREDPRGSEASGARLMVSVIISFPSVQRTATKSVNLENHSGCRKKPQSSQGTPPSLCSLCAWR